MKYFKLPDLGEGLPEAEIVEWHIEVGDTVKTDEIIVSVETAKAIVEVPSPQDGTIAALFGHAGDLIHTGEPLLEYVEGKDSDTGTVVGKMDVATQAEQEDHFFVGHPGIKAGTQPHHTATPQATTVKAALAVRQLAKRFNVNLDDIKGTGPNQRITEEDVQNTIHLQSTIGPTEPLKGVRRTMAKTMAKAHSEVVPVTLSEEVDIHQWQAHSDTTLRLIRAIGVACQKEPALNAWYDGNSLSRRLMTQVDLGIAVDTPDGLFVPVMFDILHRAPQDLRRGLQAMRNDIKDRSIPPKNLQGATITLSNFGTIAGKFASPIVVPPQVAIIGAGVVRQQPVAYQNQVAIHPILPISLSFDHRSITGGEAARFLKALIADLQSEQ